MLRRKLPFLMLAILVACSNERELYFKTDVDERAVRMARKISIEIPEVDPDSGFELVSCKSFSIRPVDVMTNMFSLFGKNANKFASQTLPDIRETLEGTAKQIAEQIMLIDAALDAGMELSQVVIDSALHDRYEQAGGKKEFEEHFLTANQIPMEDVLLNIRRFLIVERLKRKIYSKWPPVTEEELRKAYEQPKTATIRAIFFSTDYKTPEEKSRVREKAEDVLAMARNGTDFKELTIIYNEDPATRRLFGVYTNIQRGDLDKAIEEAAFSLPLDGISDVIETESGYYIIQVEDKVKEPRPFEEVREELRKTLEDRRKKEALDSFVEKLKAKENYQFHRLP